MDEACSTCMHSKVIAGRFYCECPAVRYDTPERHDRARAPMDNCEHWDTLNPDYDGGSEDGQRRRINSST